MYQVAPTYRPRFIPAGTTAELVNLYHLARTALCAEKDSDGKPKDTPYWRKLWASEQFAKTHAGKVSLTGAYKDLCGILGH